MAYLWGIKVRAVLRLVLYNVHTFISDLIELRYWIKYHILSYHIILYIQLRNIMSYLRPLDYRGRIQTSLVSQPNFLLHFFSCLLSWAFNGFRFLSLTDNRSLFSHTHHPTPIHGGLNLCILCTFIVKLKFFTSWKIFMFLSM